MVFFLRLALFTSLANSFVIRPNRFICTKLQSVKELAPIDLMCIEDVAELCLSEYGKDECDVDDMIATSNQLDDQDHILHSKVDELDHLLYRLRTEAGVHDLSPGSDIVDPANIHLAAKHQLEPMDLMCVENQAELCLSEYGECSLEDNEALVNQLKDQRDILLKEMYHVERLMKDLNQYTSVFARDDDEIDSLMGSIGSALKMDEVAEVGPRVHKFDVP
eukprot:CAMPEP_0195258844 /NCGR_PEP_ID=MMETSP0706-20130129/7621_1 /TAXON_ID=33640 /ORGANISM="Asterionellopsis glacialis, Strain CCMP134" /LENGTH=219 /DNA_ID=CAMNT_0040312251 /DNA_START=73 /DNA_END=732 /DNA_ORIENTATION=+